MTEQAPETIAEAYVLAKWGVIRASDGASIPDDEGNRDWREYLAWCAEGNVADPIPVVIPDPQIAEDAATKATATAKISADLGLTPAEAVALFGDSGTP